MRDSPTTPLLLVDVNEPVNVAGDLEAKGIPVSRVDLPTGDYVWVAHGKTWGVERKAGPDLVSSLLSGRLADQVRRLLEMADFPVLLVEGYVEQWGWRKVHHQYGRQDLPWSMLDNALLEVQLHGLNIVREPLGHTAERVAELYRWSLKEEHGLLRQRTRKMAVDVMDPEYGRAMNMLTCLPGVGEKAAKALLERFGSVQRVLTASPQELMEVEGVGKKTARAIQEAVTAPVVVGGFRR